MVCKYTENIITRTTPCRFFVRINRFCNAKAPSLQCKSGVLAAVHRPWYGRTTVEVHMEHRSKYARTTVGDHRQNGGYGPQKYCFRLSRTPVCPGNGMPSDLFPGCNKFAKLRLFQCITDVFVQFVASFVRFVTVDLCQQR